MKDTFYELINSANISTCIIKQPIFASQGVDIHCRAEWLSCEDNSRRLKSFFYLIEKIHIYSIILYNLMLRWQGLC